jgi:uncharacterized protein YjiS (DUF1127 family)
MSTFTPDSMINRHAEGVIGQIGETLHVWHQRYRTRRELSQWTSRDLHDVGLSWADIASEIEKPFWRA